MTTTEKKEAVLQFLYDRRHGNRNVDLCELATNNSLISNDDLYWMIGSLRNKGYVEGMVGLHSRITLEGAEYVEALGMNAELFDQYNPTDKISLEEQKLFKDKIDELLERLKKLELGQQVIYDDLEEELQQLKELVSVLGRKDWRQMLLGKLIDAGLGSVAGEVMKVVVATFPNQNFLN